MKVTYVCDRCGAIIGSLNLTEEELLQIGVELPGADLEEDIIQSTATGALFIYSLCDHCVDAVPIHEVERGFLGKQGMR